MDPPPPAPLPDDLVEAILLRIPPSDPATLARAAVAQKRWYRLVAGPGFRSRYRALHRAPPMLGFFCDSWDGTGFSNSFVPASSFRSKPRADRRQLRVVDARHGRVLLRSYGAFSVGLRNAFRLIVWDPITGHQVVLPRPKGFGDEWNCAAPTGSCDHHDCHRGHFIVVLIGDDYPTRGMLSCVYSSQDGAWSKIIFAQHLDACLVVHSERSSHMGNALYYMSGWGNKIVKYDLGTRELSMMEPPILLSREDGHPSERIQLTTMEDGQLGLAVLRDFTLYILSTNEEFGWEGTKIIDLKKCGNYDPIIDLFCFVGDIGLVFMDTGKNGILSVDISSAQVKVVCRKECIRRIVPYIHFCTPAMGVPSRDEKPRTVASRDVHSSMASSLLRQVNHWLYRLGCSSGSESLADLAVNHF